MKVARYMGSGDVQIVDEPTPTCPEGGLLIRTEACGLCSGELMDWYMDRKIPHVLGHEVAGIVSESRDSRFPVGSRVFPHHHAPCLECEECKQGRFVHCAQWKSTKLEPGGMAEFFAVGPQNLTDTIPIGDTRAVDAALIEPIACVHKSIRLGRVQSDSGVAVVGLGAMGLIHTLLLPGAVGFDLNESRLLWATNLGIECSKPDGWTRGTFDRIFVCPGSQAAFDFALSIANPEAVIVMFAPLPAGQDLRIDQAAYFRDIAIVNSYSCGPNDTIAAFKTVAEGVVRAEMIASDFISIDQLPEAYRAMKTGEILKSMVVFP